MLAGRLSVEASQWTFEIPSGSVRLQVEVCIQWKWFSAKAIFRFSVELISVELICSCCLETVRLKDWVEVWVKDWDEDWDEIWLRWSLTELKSTRCSLLTEVYLSKSTEVYWFAADQLSFRQAGDWQSGRNRSNEAIQTDYWRMLGVRLCVAVTNSLQRWQSLQRFAFCRVPRWLGSGLAQTSPAKFFEVQARQEASSWRSVFEEISGEVSWKPNFTTEFALWTVSKTFGWFVVSVYRLSLSSQ